MAVSVSREHILSEIQRTAEENGGVPLGRQRFQAATGLRAADWERYWARWSDAVREAGFSPNALTSRYADEDLLRPLAHEVRRLGRMPTRPELAIRRREGAPLPSPNVFGRWPKQELTERTLAYCREHADLADVAAILEPLVAEHAATSTAGEEERGGDDDADFGFVYLIKSGPHYKLGRTNSMGRRERELAIQLPERAATVHSIKTDDPAGIEAYWHRRFAERRGNGEWFALTQADVRAFRRRRFM
jgi:hypothetical protein